MRDVFLTVVMALGIVAVCLSIAWAIIGTHEQHEQLRNVYQPFTVEMQVRDR